MSMVTDPREMATTAVAFAKPRLRGWLHAVTSPLALARRGERTASVTSAMTPRRIGALPYEVISREVPGGRSGR